MRGRKPLPTAILKAQGTYQASRHQDRVEVAPIPETEVSQLQPPKHLTAGAKKVWKELLLLLLPQKFLSAQDLTNFAVYCSLVDRWQREHQDLTVPQLVALANAISKAGSDFGFTPASRAKVTMPTKEDSASEKMKYFA